MDEKDIESNKIMAILAYLGILILIPIFAAKNSRFARYHANQALILLIVSIVIEVPLGLLSLIPYVGWIFTIIESLVGLVILIVWLLGIINAAQGKAKELPYIGKYRILK